MSNPQALVKDDTPRSRFQRVAAYATLIRLACVLFLVDRVSKIWITQVLPYNPYHEHVEGMDITVIPNFFYLIHIGNTGAAWSIFSGASTFLALLALATLGALFYWRHQLGLRHPRAQVAFGLLCGGIVGNLVDRLVYKHVIDFVDLHFGTYVYPTFNVADSAILIGVILYLWFSWRQPNPAS